MRKLAEINEPNTKTVADYVRSRRLIGRAERTIIGETWNMKPFFCWLEDRPVQDLTRGDIEDWILYRKERVNQTTLHNGVLTLRTFFNWLKPDNDFFVNIKTRQPKNKLPVNQILTEDDVYRMRNSALNQREKALIMVLWDSGVRKGELLNMNIGDIQFEFEGIPEDVLDMKADLEEAGEPVKAKVIVRGKTGERVIILGKSVEDLRLWINNHPYKDDDNAPLWITERQYKGKYRRLNEQTIINMLKARASKAKIKKNVYPHAFRHGRLTYLARHGVMEMTLRIFAGWEKTSNMPATYVHLAAADMEKAVRKADGYTVREDERERDVLKPIICPRCDKLNPVGSKYCNRCNTILSSKFENEVQEDKNIISQLLTKFNDPKILEQLLTLAAQQAETKA
ncbi:hypothetical protein MSSIH_2006 [Methanosarcina siciliae HI350]|uniref:Integrase n=1 Tax=Methanosarcina siciliae HI350 TaxID=1434119 RepID=A0A0E3LAV8_9EURY|nr:site-specific integrase [Methanosarcina siciliae]AKB32696.1 hypothetical protein MSSIH_2006 [Methanosarcina siciliae HI350]